MLSERQTRPARRGRPRKDSLPPRTETQAFQSQKTAPARQTRKAPNFSGPFLFRQHARPTAGIFAFFPAGFCAVSASGGIPRFSGKKFREFFGKIGNLFIEICRTFHNDIVLDQKIDGDRKFERYVIEKFPEFLVAHIAGYVDIRNIDNGSLIA